MFTVLRSGLGNALRTKVGLALIGALLVGGGGTVMAMATSHGQLPLAAALSSSASTPHATRTAGKDDQDDQDECSSTHATPGANSGSDDRGEHESGTPSAHATLTVHSDAAAIHASGTPSATRAAGQGDDEANEHESAQEEQDECSKSSTASRTPHPEPTERPEGPEGTHTPWPTRAPQPTGTLRPGGD
jgi:hypothetical protein